MCTHCFVVVQDKTHTWGHQLPGHVAGMCCSDSFPPVSSPFLRKCSVAGTEFCPRNMLHEIQLV